MTTKRGLWGTRFGLYLVAIGSAFGLGNLWRFPSVVVENGGGAFVILYVFLALFLGFPLLSAELLYGKVTRRSLLSALSDAIAQPELEESRWKRFFLRWTGRLSMTACLGLLSYYAVISGWVLHFIVQFFTVILTGHGVDPTESLQVLRENGMLQVALMSVHLILVLIVVAQGVEKGVERWLSLTMPVFFVLSLLLIVQSMRLPTSMAALRYLFYPDFSKLNSSSLIEALGHVCFTLSIGFGSMVTFGSYLRSNSSVPETSLRVIGMDTLLSLIGGLIIFPIVISSQFHVWGPEVLFQTLPRLVEQLPGGRVFGLLFFLCLYLAALGASVGLMEVLVSNWLDRQREEKRVNVTWKSALLVFVIALFPALSSSVFRSINFHGLGIMEIVDSILITWILPITAIAIALSVSALVHRDRLWEEFDSGTSKETRKVILFWRFVIQTLAPTIVIFALLLRFINFLWHRQ